MLQHTLVQRGRAGESGCWLMTGSVSLSWLFLALNPIRSSTGEWCFTGSWSEPIAWDRAHDALRAASTHRRHRTFEFPKGWICPCYRLGAKPLPPSPMSFHAGSSGNRNLSFKLVSNIRIHFDFKDELSTAFAEKQGKRDTLSLEKLYTLYFRTLV